MQERQLGCNGLEVSAIGFGCMGLTSARARPSRRKVTRACEGSSRSADRRSQELTMSATSYRSADARSVGAVLLPIMAAVSIAFLVMGIALPVLPLHVHQGLGLGTFVVGLVADSQFMASLLSRVWAGRFADGRGAKHAVVAGLLAAAMGGLLYLLSLRSSARPGHPSRYCCSAARSSAGPKASSSRVGSAGGWPSPARRTREGSSPGSGWQCSPPSRSGLPWGPPSTPSAASRRSRPRRRLFRLRRSPSSPL